MTLDRLLSQGYRLHLHGDGSVTVSRSVGESWVFGSVQEMLRAFE